ncbi:MAG: hypothetical protein WCR42_07965 [bacterium]
MPAPYPDFYLGLNLAVQNNFNSGKYTFTENYVPCCEFTKGSGNGFNIGLGAEKWFQGSWAAGIKAGYSLYSNTFTTQNTYPRVDYNVTYQLDFNSSYSYLSFELFYKKRIADYHLNVTGSLKTDILINQSNDFSESIIAPKDEEYVDGTTKRTIANGAIAPLNSLVLIPTVGVGYDISLNRGKFLSFNIYSELPLMSLVNQGSWRRWSVGADFLLYYGIFL